MGEQQTFVYWSEYSSPNSASGHEIRVFQVHGENIEEQENYHKSNRNCRTRTHIIFPFEHLIE